jgi:hypothetical protein
VIVSLSTVILGGNFDNSGSQLPTDDAISIIFALCTSQGLPKSSLSVTLGVCSQFGHLATLFFYSPEDDYGIDEGDYGTGNFDYPCIHFRYFVLPLGGKYLGDYRPRKERSEA